MSGQSHSRSVTSPGNDHDALRNLLQRYARAADARDPDALGPLFEPGATIDGSRGELVLESWLEVMRDPPAFPASMHYIGDPLIEVQGDEARLDTYAVVYQLGDRSSGQQDLTLGIRYLDVAVRGDSGWRIRSRTARTIWMR
jgi:SnoaL-like domain